MATDDEKTLMELQDRILVGTQGLTRVANMERMAINRKVRTELMLRELDTLPAEVRSYRSVGKAYFLSSHAEVVQEAKEVIALCDGELSGLKTQKGVLEKKIGDAETELRELIRSSPHIVKQLAQLRAN